MKVFTFICVHVWETNTCARVNLYDMSKYKFCWSWSVSQFSTCMSLLRHGCQRNNFWNFQTDSQMYSFSDQMNWQFVQILMDSKFHSKLCVLDTNDVKQKTSLFSVQGNLLGVVSRILLFCFTSSVSGTQNKCPNSHDNHPPHQFITWIYHEFKVQNGLIL